MSVLTRAIRWPFLGLIRAYQLIVSPWTGASCRFAPSCSTYAYQAIETHGVLRGSLLAARRLGRCHPWNPGGIDPVPSRTPSSARGA